MQGKIYNTTQVEDFFLVLEPAERRRSGWVCFALGLGVAGSDLTFLFSSSEESSFFSSSLELLEELLLSSSVNKHIHMIMTVLQTLSDKFTLKFSQSQPMTAVSRTVSETDVSQCCPDHCQSEACKHTKQGRTKSIP